MNSALANPFRSFNRLESQTRLVDFERSLRCEIHDPLWMLGRQWQFGELQGEDAGSAIFAKVLVETAPIVAVQFPDEQPHPYDRQAPLEMLAEQFSWPEDYYDVVKAARRFLQLLDVALADQAGYQASGYIEKLQALFPLALPQPEAGDPAETQVLKAQLLTNEKLVSFLSAAQHWTFNAMRLYRKILSDTNFVVSSLALSNAHRPKLTAAVAQFKTWYQRRHPELAANAWDTERLEHRFSVGAPAPSGLATTVLNASEYAAGELQWYHFDKARPDTANRVPLGVTPDDRKKIQRTAGTMLPSAARYSGMPASRWWEFENGSVNLTLAGAGETDLARLVVAQYALIYSNDWLTVPFTVPNGALAEVKGIVVTDTFGFRTFIRPAAQAQTGNWQSWGLFNLSAPSAYAPADARTLVLPTAPPALTGDPLESVWLLRDEMANMVWGLEELIPGHLRDTQDGYRTAQTLRERLEALDPSLVNHAEGVIPGAVLDYTLATEVPENWIPFMPVHISGQQRAILLQRASMPRWFAQTYTRSRPRTVLLRTGMAPMTGPDDLPAANVGQYVQQQPYFIHEEEVPRAGIKVETRAKRARWYDGARVQWVSRRKMSGRGEAGSGLEFDALRWVK